MKVIATALAILVFGTSIAGAPAMQQKPNPDADRIALKVRRIEILDQLLPVLLTKDQIKKILPEIEKAHKTELDIQKKELEQMKEFEPKLDKALTAAIKDRKLPDDEFVLEYLKMFSSFKNKRAYFLSTSAKALVLEMKKVMNEGQLKTAELSLNPLLFGEKDPEKMTSDEKLVLWAREVLLDRAAYSLLVDMSFE